MAVQAMVLAGFSAKSIAEQLDLTSVLAYHFMHTLRLQLKAISAAVLATRRATQK